MTDEINHLEEIRARVPDHMRAGENYDRLLQALSKRCQDIESVLFDLLLLRTINEANGAQLDGIGQIVDLTRIEGQTDTSYRYSLKSRFILLSKSGSVEEVIKAFMDVMMSSTVEYTEIYPATFQIAAIPTVDITDPDVAAFINDTMQKIKPAGVNMILSTVTGFTMSQASEADIDGNGPIDADEGFGSDVYDELDGGGLAGVI